MQDYNLEKIRNDFPILNRKVNNNKLVYLDNAATSQKPNSVIQSLNDYYTNYNSNVHRGVHKLSVEATDEYEKARFKIADFINASSNEIIWTRNTSESINIVSIGLKNKVNSGDNIVVSRMEHHSNLVPWQQLCKEKNAELRYLDHDIAGRIDLDQAKKIIDKNTKIIAITHMSNVLGVINPINSIREISKKNGTLLVLDGAQSAPHFSVDMKEIDCDFFSFSAHKMLGPTGIGVLYGKEALLEEMDPFYFGGDMISEVTYEGAKWNDLPYKFEAGTPNIADAIATGFGVDYLVDIGMDNITKHEDNITNYALEKMKDLTDYKIIGPLDMKDRGGVISFTHNSVHPHDVGEILDKFGVAIRTGHHCAMPLVRSYEIVAACRASFYLYNTYEEIDIFINSLKEAESYFNKL
ncbi:MAG: cysteine desulfurase [Dehalococcoidia bacterium]|nr:cysteine desulfurase [Chloroflexota bacterium]RZP13330.1 MAG: cysteine desulfurase [Chloroflexota bacterium]|tara:strand:+ start:4517 stop:5746 length:1230 start_codon:yes stop_codon:yes gene_type:complete